MEETDQVSFSTPDEPLLNQPNMSAETIRPQTNNETINPEMDEENITLLTKEETRQTNDGTITSETAEEAITSSLTGEINITPKITEVCVSPDTAEERSQTTNISPKTTELNMSAEARLPPEETQVTSTSYRTEQNTAREIPERSLQDSEMTDEMKAEFRDVTSSEVMISWDSARVCSREIRPERRTHLTSEDIQQKKASPHPSSSYEPAPASAPVSASNFSAELWDSPAVVSQDGANLTMDSFGKNSTGFEPDVLNQSDDDFTFEVKNSYFPAFSPVNDAGDGLTRARRSVEVSDSPSPDLVQDAYDGDGNEDVTRPQEIKPLFDSSELTFHSYMQQHASSDIYSTANKEADDRPVSLPDILKSSPLNPEKVDSGSSEGSPDFSPAHKSGNDSPNAQFSVSAVNPFGLDSKISLLKEMAEETETRAAEQAKLGTEKISEQSFVAFDLVKETDAHPKSNQQLKEDAEMFTQTSVQMSNKFECLNFPPGKAQEHSDSDSPSADSFSPVLDAVAKKPSGFSVEHDNTVVRQDVDDVSEQDVSSEEFEFVERPPQGAADEFPEIQDSSMFIKPSEMLVDEEQSPKLEASHEKRAAQDTKDHSSSHLLSQLSDKSSPVRGKAGLESAFQEISPASPIHTPVDQTELEKIQPKVSGSMPSLRPAAVLDLLYWRNVRWSAAVLSSSLLLLLSLSSCSIISVIAYAAMTLLSVTVTFRIYKGILQAIQKSEEGHPFKQYLDKDVALSKDLVQKYSDVALGQINSGLMKLRHLFLVEDLVDSLKFAVILWIFTYVGSWFNGLTLIILGLLGAFSCPVMYEKHQTDIDQYINIAKNQMKETLGKIQAKVSGIKKME